MERFNLRHLVLSCSIGAALLAAGPSLAQDCKPKHEFTTVEKGYLTVAPGTYPPYSYVDSSGELQGIDGDIAKVIAAMECLKVKAIPALLGFSILVFQGTSLCFTIALQEIISRAYDIGNTTFLYFPALAVAAVFFAAVCIPASLLVSYIEQRTGKHVQR